MQTINYFRGLYGVIFFDIYASEITYMHENDGDFTRKEYINPVLKIVNAEIEQVSDFNKLHTRVKQELFDMEESSEEEYL